MDNIEIWHERESQNGAIFRFVLSEEINLYLQEFTKFFYDFELLYDFLTLLSYEEYEDEYSLWEYNKFALRSRDYVKDDNRLIITTLKKESPAEVTLEVLRVTGEISSILSVICILYGIIKRRITSQKTRGRKNISNEEAFYILESIDYELNDLGEELSEGLLTAYEDTLKKIKKDINKERTIIRIIKRLDRNPLIERIDELSVQVRGIKKEYRRETDEN